MEDRNIRNDIVAFALLAGIIFLFASLMTYDRADPVKNPISALDQVYQPDQLVHPLNESPMNACGELGAWVADLLFYSLGFGAYFLLLGMVALEVALFRKQDIESPWLRTVGWGMCLIGLTILFSAWIPASWVSPVIGAGGYLG